MILKRPNNGLHFDEHKQVGHLLNKQYAGRDTILFSLALGAV
jgi:hypothetical protein